MANNHKNLIVGLANDGFIDQVKQLFSSIYFNAGWTGDYLLLAHEVSEEKLIWFRNKGIKIYKTKALGPDTGPGNYPTVVLSKFYLFKEYFKKWDTVVFLDADIIVRASLDRLLNVSGFSAPTVEHFNLAGQFTKDKKIIQELELNKKYNLKKDCLCSGIFAFNTDLIQPDTFSKIMSIYQKYKRSSMLGEESILNLFFYNNWQPLPIVYNCNLDDMRDLYGLKSHQALYFIVHFGWKVKPWKPESVFYQEWQENLKKAEEIDLKNRPAAEKIISDKELKRYLTFLYFKKNPRSVLLFIDRQIGRLGLLIKKFNPKFYSKISKNKNESWR